MSNIAEGFERTGIQEKIHFYNIARASFGEVRSHLYVFEEVYSIESAMKQALQDHVVRAGQLITGLVKSTQIRKLSPKEDRRSEIEDVVSSISDSISYLRHTP